MIHDEKLNESPTAETTDMIEVTPALLQRYAASLELAARDAVPGQSITLKISRHRTLRYRFDPQDRKNVHTTAGAKFEGSATRNYESAPATH